MVDDDGLITEAGRQAAKLPADPAWYNAIVEGHKLGCSDEIVTLAALASIGTGYSIFLRPRAARKDADRARCPFFDPTSDHLTLLAVMYHYVCAERLGTIDMDRWCLARFLSRRRLEEIYQVRNQLKEIAQKLLKQPLKEIKFGSEDYSLNIRKALTRGFFHHAAIHYEDKDDDIYETVNHKCPVGISAESACVGANHEWVIYDSLYRTGRQYMHTVTAIDPEWLIVCRRSVLVTFANHV